MPIYSSNRVYGAGSGKSIVAAEGYTENDFGRILSECAINDMRLFNAAIARDFKEAKALNEGTMVASELQAFQEFSVKEAWKGLKEKVKKLWSKIKGAIKTAYAKLSLWFNRNTKAFVATHRKELLNKPGLSECPCPKYLNPKRDFSAFDLGSGNELKFVTDKNVKGITDLINGKGFSDVGTAITNSGFNSRMDVVRDITADKVYKEMEESYFNAPNEKLTFGQVKYSVDQLLDALTSNSKYLKSIRKMDKTTDRNFKALVGKIDKAEKEAEKKESASDFNGEKTSNIYKAASKLVSAYQVAISAYMSSAIKLLKKAISNDRGLVATLVAYNGPKTESTMLEFAYATGFDMLHEETEDMTPESMEAEAEEEGINIDITVSGDVDADVTVNDETEE